MNSDLKRMEKFYSNRSKNEWSVFNCYPFFLDCKQTFILTKILNNSKLEEKKILDIGAGEGNFLLKLISFGVKPKNITAIEYLENRYDKLREKLPQINTINNDFLNVDTSEKYDIITIMAVLTSITDNTLRYDIFKKALNKMSDNGMIILYDYFDESERFLNENYRALSLSKINKIAKDCKIEVYKNVYLKSKYAKGFCKIGLQFFIPLIESLKIFNDSYCFVVVKK